MANIKMSTTIEKHFSISIHGAHHVGKTNLCCQFLRQTLPRSYDDDLDMSTDRILNIADNKYTVSVMDTAFSQTKSVLSYLPLTLGNAAILMYSVTDAVSFQMVVALKKAIRQLDPHGWIPIVLVAAKHNSNVSDSDRMVSMQDGIAMGMAWDCPYFEIVTHDTTNNEVDMIFMTLVEKLLVQREQQQQQQQQQQQRFTSWLASFTDNSYTNHSMAANTPMPSHLSRKSSDMSTGTVESTLTMYYGLKQFFYTLIL